MSFSITCLPYIHLSILNGHREGTDIQGYTVIHTANHSSSLLVLISCLRQVVWVTFHYKSSFHVWDRFYEWLHYKSSFHVWDRFYEWHFIISPHFMFETGCMSDSSLKVVISCLRQVLWVTLHYKSSFHVWDRFYEWLFIISPHFMFETGCMSDSSL